MLDNPRELPTGRSKVECVIIGYNEEPFSKYERLIRNYGPSSVAYRDLNLSCLDVASTPTKYVDVLNYAIEASGNARLKETLGTLQSGDIPNLAAAYLTNYLLGRGINAKFINLFQSEKDVLASYLSEAPYCVAITTTFYVLNSPLYEMIDFIRKHNRAVKIVVGGPLISNHYRNYTGSDLATALKDIKADVYVVDAQGEETLLNIVTHIRDNKDLSGVPNIVIADNGALKATALKPENNSLDDNDIDWRNVSTTNLGATLQTRTARSCAFSCSFCNYPTRAGKLTLASVETVERELSTMKTAGGVKNVVFIDDTFNVPLKRFKELCRSIIKNRYSFNWYSYFRCSNADEEAIELMNLSGCKGVFLGIESGSPEILEKMHKIARIDDYVRGMELLHKYGILTFASFITGFPGETERTVRETKSFIKETAPTYYRSQVWYCEHGTPIYEQRDKYGIKGSGFVWQHATMTSSQAISHVEDLVCSISESTWLPQWSFDFWIIPYLLGKGIAETELLSFLKLAHRILASKIEQRARGHVEETSNTLMLRQLVNEVSGWSAVRVPA
jgi:radical SAM PhpK family P-methyltransferase